jgi:hypothetical protein
MHHCPDTRTPGLSDAGNPHADRHLHSFEMFMCLSGIVHFAARRMRCFSSQLLVHKAIKHCFSFFLSTLKWEETANVTVMQIEVSGRVL